MMAGMEENVESVVNEEQKLLQVDATNDLNALKNAITAIGDAMADLTDQVNVGFENGKMDGTNNDLELKNDDDGIQIEQPEKQQEIEQMSVQQEQNVTTNTEGNDVEPIGRVQSSDEIQQNESECNQTNETIETTTTSKETIIETVIQNIETENNHFIDNEEEIPDQFTDFVPPDEPTCNPYDLPDQYEDYLSKEMEEISLDDDISYTDSDTSSVKKVKKNGRVMGGLRSIASGGAKIVMGGKDVIYGTGKGTVKGTMNAGKSVKNTTVNFAKATADVVGDVANTTSKIATGTRDVIVTGANAVAHTTVSGAEAIAHGTVKAAGAVMDGASAVAHTTVSGAEAIAHGTVKAAGAVMDGTRAGAGFVADSTVKAAVGVKDTTVSFAKASANAVTDVAHAGKSGVNAVGHGIESAANSMAETAQRNVVSALTIGLKMADNSLTVVPKAIAAKPP